MALPQRFTIHTFTRHIGRNVIPALRKHYLQVLKEMGKETRDQVRALAGEDMTGIGPYPAWAPLKQSTIDRKTKRRQGKGGNAASPLWATGKFASDIEYHVVPIKMIAVVGTRKKYMENHEFGFVHHISGKSVHPRPIFGPAAEMVIPGFRNRIKLAIFTGITGGQYGRF